MSHFTVAVFTDNEFQDIDDLLAPYDESLSVEAYVDLTKEELIRQEREHVRAAYENQYAEWTRDPIAYEKRSNPTHIDYLRSIPERMKWTDEQHYLSAIELYNEDEITSDGSVLTRYNPNSKWDWYIIGGRWQDMLMLKTDMLDRDAASGSAIRSSSGCDCAYVADIDFDAMRKKQYECVRPYQEALKNGFYKEEYMRELYPSEIAYFQQVTTFSTYAVITPDGTWHAPGDMGWFGMSSESGSERRDWEDEYFERFIKPALQNGWYLTIVDCHI